MDKRKAALFLVLLLGFLSALKPVILYAFPLSWDIYYHARIADGFAAGDFLHDKASFAPEGRVNGYPPLFHIVLALLSLLTGASSLFIARFLPPLLFVATLYAFFYMAKRMMDEKTSLVATLLCSITPIILDKGLSPTPELLSFPLLFACFLSFYEERIVSSLFLFLVFVTHGLTFVSCISTLLLFSLWISITEKKSSQIRFLSKALLLFFALSSPYVLLLLNSGTSLPFGGRHLLSFYPTKLGWVNVLFACMSLPFLKRERSHIFLLSFFSSGFLLSFNPFLLPARFLEFMAWPMALLAAIAFQGIFFNLEKNKTISIFCIIFLLCFLQSHAYTEKYRPEISSPQNDAFEWLNQNTITGNVFSDWQTSTMIAVISKKPVFWGGYEPTAPRLSERQGDASLIETSWENDLLEKYGIVYIIPEGRKEVPFDRIYCSTHPIFFVPPKA